MLDIQLLRSDLDSVVNRLAARGFTLDAAAFQTLENERKQVQTRTQDLQAKRNATSKQIGMANFMYFSDAGKPVNYDNWPELWMTRLAQQYSAISQVRICPTAPERSQEKLKRDVTGEGWVTRHGHASVDHATRRDGWGTRRGALLRRRG